MFDMIGLAINEVLNYVGLSISYLLTSSTFGGVLNFRPLFYIGIGICVLFFAIKIIRSTVWGR